MPSPGSFAAGDILTAADLNAIGVWDSYTPVLAQNGTRSATVNYAKYVVINKMCTVNVDLTCATTGSAGNIMTVSLPFTASNYNGALGTGVFYDDSATDMQLTTVVQNSTTTVRFVTDASTSSTSGLGANPSLALASNDVISFSIVYLVA